MKELKTSKEETTNNDELFWRFNAFHRFTHFLVLASFSGLVYTGMPLKYRHAGWAKWFMSLMGGAGNAAYIHRVFAAITFLYFVAHIFYVIWAVGIRKESFLGANSMIPRMKDLYDIRDNVRYFLGLGPKPQFGRYTYWEKFDYLVVFWGVPVIGLGGLLLWFPDIASKFLPGWALNIAQITHSDEALLATAFIFVVHFWNTHIRFEKFPLDPVIFTGVVTKEELMHERPEEWELLSKNPKLLGKRKVK